MRYGIALDLGTSGFRTQAIDLDTKETVATAITERHPIPGMNVIDHVNFAIKSGEDVANGLMIGAINNLFKEFNIDLSKVEVIAVCGNPFQLSLFQNIEIRDLAYAGKNMLKELGVVSPPRDGDVIDTQTMLVHPMHVLDDEDGKFTIRFWDSGNLLAYQEIDETTIVEEGFNFYELPANPTKDGLSFMGWYLDPDSPDGMADPGEPVTDDLDLYARWGGGTGGGTSTVVVHETHVVTFEAVNGLRYDVVSVGEDSVTFMVTPSEGFEFDLSSIRVESTSGMITSGNGIYVLSSIDRDIVVTVTGLQKFTIDYRLEGTSISVPGYDGVPGHTVSGPFSAELVPEEGNELSSVMVLMDGRDVTSEFVHGSFIHIDDVSGNLVIVAEATPDSGIGDGFPWWALVLIVVLIIVALLAYARHRSRA